MRCSHSLALAAALLALAAPLSAQTAGDAQAMLTESLAGATFSGTYLRAGSPYSMNFHADGRLSDSAKRSGRWWVDEAGDYCREWTDGPMAGVPACMKWVVNAGRVEIFSGADKVLEGELIRAAPQ
ncbi:MAG: hypothetical protein ACFCUG_09530 [Thiotrichales bacterium]